MNPEHAEKRRRLLDLLKVEGLDGLVLRRPANLSWYSGGGRFHIIATPDVAVADIVVTPAGDQLVTTVNEAPRLKAEELSGLSAELLVLPWTEDRIEALPTGTAVGSDGTVPGTRDVSKLVEQARQALTPPEIDRYRSLGQDAAAAVTEACTALLPTHTEHDAAAATAAALLKRSIDPIVLLVAGESRLPHYRHPLPTGSVLGAVAMIVVCARRHGLIASLTRLVGFAPLSPELRSSHARLLQVEAVFNAGTRPGRLISEVFRDGIDAYGVHGFPPDEWQRHHQGGPTGYEPRDLIADSVTTVRVQANQAYAWNPSGIGVKSEDTILAHDDGPEVLTLDPSWPSTIVAGMRRPLILER